ncbi:MAG: hypothetical protein GY943_12815 [Chloroflexi bacterium]|nr:hypothetical protein [Chloroflexota bacterium]
MQNNQINSVTKMFEYNLWANTQLITLCNDLVADQLEAEVEGGFGQIHPTLVHIVRAEGGYLNRMTGSRPWADDLDWDNMSMSELLAKAQLSGEQLITIASKVDPAIRHDIEFQGEPYHFFNWTVVLQALYHGIEHRTQIKILLTQLGVEHPELAAWDYMDSLTSQ